MIDRRQWIEHVAVHRPRAAAHFAPEVGTAVYSTRGRPCADATILAGIGRGAEPPAPGSRPKGRRLLEIYDSLSHERTLFTPLERGVVRMYVCGITPYEVGHLGHARTFVFFDVVRRYLEFQAYEVRHVQNITDVDDDMLRVSRRDGLTIRELTDRNQAVYLREMDALNVLRPDAFPRASEAVPAIIEMVQSLIARQYAYAVDGYVFFDSTYAPRLGAIVGLERDDLLRFRSDSMPDEPAHLKRDPLDFLLWQPSTLEGATFESPWGAGRPGWHIECSAMVGEALGERIDIHGGGSDLAYPHHASEIAQSEAATGAAPFASQWMHVGTLQLDGVKMSKSLGNLVKVSELLAEGHSPDAIRLYLLSRHYRAEHNFEGSELDKWEQRSTLLHAALEAHGAPPDQLRVMGLRNEFQSALDDDFDTPRAIEALFDIADGLQRRTLQGDTAIPTLIELSDVLGLRLGREG